MSFRPPIVIAANMDGVGYSHIALAMCTTFTYVSVSSTLRPSMISRLIYFKHLPRLLYADSTFAHYQLSPGPHYGQHSACRLCIICGKGGCHITFGSSKIGTGLLFARDLTSFSSLTKMPRKTSTPKESRLDHHNGTASFQVLMLIDWS